MNDAGSPPPLAEKPPRRISPWWLIVGGAGFAMLLFGSFAVLAIALREEPPQTMGIATATMPDGTILVLEQVTVAPHSFDVEMPLSPGFTFFPTRRVENLTAYGSDVGMALWFSRRDARRTDRYLDFEWWARCVVVDENGWEVQDDNPGIHGFGNGGSSGSSGSRPISVNSSGTKYERIIAHSTIPRIRHQGGTFKLRVYNFADEVVAEFDVPDVRLPTPIPEWTAPPLPVTASDGNVTMQINNVTSNVYTWNSSQGIEENVQINLATEFFEDGQPAPHWYMSSCQLSDALGNTSYQYGCKLSPFEPAWKVSARAFRTEDAVFTDDEKWTATALDLPAADTGMLISETRSFGPAQVVIAALGGGGSTKYTSLGGAGTNSSYGGTAGEATFSIDHDSNYSYSGARTPSTTQIDCALPHLVLRIESMPDNHSVELLVTDDQQQPVKSHGPYQISEMYFWFFEPAEGARSITPTVILQEGRNFELLIKPPEIIRPSRRLPESEVLQRVASVATTPLLYSSKRTDNAELMLAAPGAAELVNLTNNSSNDSGCAWSPDGSRIVFESERDGTHALWIMNADGSDVHKLTTSEFGDYAAAWSPDGEHICFRRITNDPNQNWELFVINVDGSGETNLTNNAANDADPSWSPDGERIAFTSTREGAWYLYTMAADGSDVLVLSKTSNGYVYPAWSPDGSTIAFTGWDGAHHEIYVIDADGQNEIQLTELDGQSSHAAWLPDGSRIAFDLRKDNFPWGQGTIYTMRPDGSDLQEMIPIEALVDGGRPAWKPPSTQ
jgi:WD40 repeat protein